jgi:Arc/MetJ-type ribon-helix-helix transcriptional regulator
MKNYRQRIAIRLSAKQREQIEKLIKKGKYKSLSHFIRTIFDNFFSD